MLSALRDRGLSLVHTHSGKLVSLAAGDLLQHSEFRIKITAQPRRHAIFCRTDFR